MYTIIVAKAKNNVIGRTNDMPWKIKEDLKFFRDKTIGHKIILGRKNYDAIGHPLKNRENIILTRDKGFKVEGALVYNDVDELIKDLAKQQNIIQKNNKEDAVPEPRLQVGEEIFVVGGAEIYKLFLDKNLVSKMYITQLDQEVEGDIFFSEVDMSNWKLTDSRRSSEGNFTYEFQTWERR